MPVENEELSDTDLFNGAVTEPEGEEQPNAQAPEPVSGDPEPPAGDPPPDPDKPTADDNAALVPSWRVREINDEKRTLADRLAALEAEKATWQRTQQQEAPKVAPKSDAIDPLLDPDGYKAAVREETRQEILADRREESLQRARDANPKDFDEAYATALKAVDPALKARMQASRDPGKTLLEWHREQKTRQEIGGDLTAYKQRLREEALKDPEFRKAAMEAWRNEGQQQTQQTNGRSRVELPPSLSSASRSNAAARTDATDVSDAELFRETTG